MEEATRSFKITHLKNGELGKRAQRTSGWKAAPVDAQQARTSHDRNPSSGEGASRETLEDLALARRVRPSCGGSQCDCDVRRRPHGKKTRRKITGKGKKNRDRWGPRNKVAKTNATTFKALDGKWGKKYEIGTRKPL